MDRRQAVPVSRRNGPAAPKTLWAAPLARCAFGSRSASALSTKCTIPGSTFHRFGDLGFIVADGRGFWAEVKRLENYSLRLLAPGTPAVEIIHTHERFRLTLRLTPIPIATFC